MSAVDDPDQKQGPKIDTAAFFLPGAGISALLIHGLSGTPYELRYLGERLAAKGVRVMGVKLAGHAATPEELGAVGYDNWYESVVGGFEHLRRFGDPIVVVGLSAGAVLGARLAADQGAAVAGLVMLSPAFFLKPWMRLALAAAGPFRRWTNLIYLPSAESDIHDTAARQNHPRTRLMPLRAPLELTELSTMVRGRLPRVAQPVLIVHGRRDHLCPVDRNVTLLTARLGSENKRVVILEDSFHVITVDSEKERVADEVIDFVTTLRPAGAEPGNRESSE